MEEERGNTGPIVAALGSLVWTHHSRLATAAGWIGSMVAYGIATWKLDLSPAVAVALGLAAILLYVVIRFVDLHMKSKVELNGMAWKIDRLLIRGERLRVLTMVGLERSPFNPDSALYEKVFDWCADARDALDSLKEPSNVTLLPQMHTMNHALEQFIERLEDARRNLGLAPSI